MQRYVFEDDIDIKTQDIQRELELCETLEAMVKMASNIFETARTANTSFHADPVQKAVANAMLKITADCVDEKMPEVAAELTTWLIDNCCLEFDLLAEERAAASLALRTAQQWLDQRGDYTQARISACQAANSNIPMDQKREVGDFIREMDKNKNIITLTDTMQQRMQEYDRLFSKDIEEQIDLTTLWAIAPIVI